MIGNIYYLIGVLVVLSTVSSILKFGKLYSLKEWKEKYEKIVGRKPSKKDFRSKKEYSLSESTNILALFEIIWIIGGFFTSSWYIFGITILSSYILNIILNPIKFTIIHKLTSFAFLLSRLCLYLYLIVNHFYLHQNTYSIVKSYIKW
jgi:type III secretory pathway component EscU